MPRVVRRDRVIGISNPDEVDNVRRGLHRINISHDVEVPPNDPSPVDDSQPGHCVDVGRDGPEAGTAPKALALWRINLRPDGAALFIALEGSGVLTTGSAGSHGWPVRLPAGRLFRKSSTRPKDCAVGGGSRPMPT